MTGEAVPGAGKQAVHVCCLCGALVLGGGNNPAPLADEGRCCDRCNRDKVVPARIKGLPL